MTYNIYTYDCVCTVGVRRSNSIEGLLPSEMRLLTGRNPKTETDEKGQNYDPSIDRRYRLQKLLFLSKFAEHSLATYEVSGWYVYIVVLCLFS